MAFDEATLTLSGGFVTLASGLFLLAYWAQDRAAVAALWWATASCGMGAGVILLALHEVVPRFASDIMAPLILDLCALATWAAARIFSRGSIARCQVIGVAAAWVALQMATGASAGARSAAASGTAVQAAFYIAAAVEFWRTRDETLPGRWPMVGLLCLMSGALDLAAIRFALMTTFAPTPGLNPLGIIHFVGLIYSVGAAFFLVTMLKERGAAAHKSAALVDPLTGLPNRRAFMDRAQRLFEQCTRDDSPISLLVFDLDRFKAVNDTFGHAAGDHVLRIFADVVSRVLRSNDVAGRLGGEEFAAVLPGCGVAAALAAAGRIRVAFQEDARFVNRLRIAATVSVGVATRAAHNGGLAEYLAFADAALYQSKHQGRNRVTLADNAGRVPEGGNVVRIA